MWYNICNKQKTQKTALANPPPPPHTHTPHAAP